MTNADVLKEQIIKKISEKVQSLKEKDLYTFMMDLYNIGEIEDGFVTNLFYDFDKVFSHLSEEEKDEYVASGKYTEDFVEWLSSTSLN